MPGKPAARLGDMHVCPMFTGLVPHIGGPILPPCAINVITGGMPQAKTSNPALCAGGPDVLIMGSPTVLVNGMMAVRMGDPTAHGGMVVIGLPTVLIGEAGGGGGSGGGGGTVAVGSGQSHASAMLSSAAATIAPAQQAAVYKAAAKAAKALCERCS